MNIMGSNPLDDFIYCPINGNASRVRKARRGKSKTGTIGSINSIGYITGYIGGKNQNLHRVAWQLYWGIEPDTVDHIDHDRANNVMANLRNVTKRENHLNSKRSVGVYPYRGRFKAQICVNGSTIHIGVYDTYTEAKSARKHAEQLYGFHKNHGNNK